MGSQFHVLEEMVYLFYGPKHKPLKVKSTQELKKIKTCTYKIALE
jgi:hypothetical protein